MQIKKEARPGAEVVLSGIIAAKDIEVFWDNAVKAAQKEVSIPGFRKGHVPEEKIDSRSGCGFSVERSC